MERLAGGKLVRDEPAPHVTRLTLDHPAKRNVLDHDVLDALAEVLPELDARCLLITGTGPVFSAGYDIGALPSERFAEAAEAIVAHPFQAALEALDAFPFPVARASCSSPPTPSRPPPRSPGAWSGRWRPPARWRLAASSWPPRSPPTRRSPCAATSGCSARCWPPRARWTPPPKRS